MHINKSEDPKNKTKTQIISFKTLFQQRDSESTFILFIVPVILTLWVYYGKQADFDQLFQGFQGHRNQDFYSAIYEYMTAFLLMFWAPYFFIKMVFKKKLSDFGFQWGDMKYGFRFVLITLPFILLIIYNASARSSIQSEYPLSKSTIDHLHLFIIVEVFYLIYYVGFEFLFRGFMIFGLEKRFGALAAILIQAIPSTIVHFGKPAGESFGAIFVSLVFGYLAIRTRSVFYSLLLHAMIGIGTDIFVTLRIL
jgi:membrane protease YdiL (CAAX protease family)